MTPHAYQPEQHAPLAVFAHLHRLGLRYNEVLREALAGKEAVDGAADPEERRRCLQELWRLGATKWRLLEVRLWGEGQLCGRGRWFGGVCGWEQVAEEPCVKHTLAVAGLTCRCGSRSGESCTRTSPTSANESASM
jgi:hypothetical protein